MQLRFKFSNEDAGHVSSLPYVLASFATPFLGSMSSSLGESYYEAITMTSLGILFTVYLTLTMMTDSLPSDTGPKNLAILPVCLFGFGHALFLTVQGPLIK